MEHLAEEEETREARAPRPAKVVPLHSGEGALVAALRSRQPGAGDELVRRHGEHLRRVAASILGPSNELADVVHEALLRGLDKIGSLRDPSQLRSWLIGITVRVAREHLRQMRRFPRTLPAEELPTQGVCIDPDARMELQCVLEVLEQLAVDDRIAFSLRHLRGMDLKAVAEATGVSLATAKRRIRRGAERFADVASQHPTLRGRVDAGDKWELR